MCLPLDANVMKIESIKEIKEIDYFLIIERHIFYIYKYLEPKDLLQLLASCKKIKEVSQNENFWENYCNLRWSKDFWEKAKERPIKSSKRFVSMYHEFNRLAEFEYVTKQIKGNYPDKSFYYDFWNTIDIKK